MHHNEYFIGDPGSQVGDWIYQDSDNCAVAAEASIINHFTGDDLTLADASYISTAHGWYQPGSGTDPSEIGRLMDLSGVPNHTVMGASMEQLASELQAGHGVIVGVNSAELWDEGILNRIKQFFFDAFGLDTATFNPADHAVVVTGIDISNPDSPMIIINDSGMPNGAAVRYPLDQFADAWQNSGFNYTATDSAPHSTGAPLLSLHGFDVGDFLGIGTSLVTGSPLAGTLVTMVAHQVDWDSILQSI
jgi:Peptidase_C39 like family